MINTGTTVVTFLMVFLIQRAQNKESRAIQLKLNELIAAMEGASNHLIGAEEFSESELATLTQHYAALVARIQREHDIRHSHSIEEALRRHAGKHARDEQRTRNEPSGEHHARHEPHASKQQHTSHEQRTRDEQHTRGANEDAM